MPRSYQHAIIACHPAAHSFTMAVAARYAETVEAHGHTAVTRDLYRLGFDPVLKADERDGVLAADVRAELQVLGEADVYVLAYPIWFGAPPAMLKGYVDRVFGAGRRRGLSDGDSRFAGKRLVSLTSSGSMRAWLAGKGVLSSLRTVYHRYFADVFGFDETHSYHFDGVTEAVTERDVRMHLLDVENGAREVMSRMRR